MNTPPPAPPRRRLQELLAIPDGQRSEAEWDELHELEISLAPGNRLDSGKVYRQDAPPKPQRPPRHAAPKPKPAGDAGGNAAPVVNAAAGNGGGGGGGGGESKRGFRRRRPKGPKPAESGSQ